MSTTSSPYNDVPTAYDPMNAVDKLLKEATNPVDNTGLNGLGTQPNQYTGQFQADNGKLAYMTSNNTLVDAGGAQYGTIDPNTGVMKGMDGNVIGNMTGTGGYTASGGQTGTFKSMGGQSPNFGFSSGPTIPDINIPAGIGPKSSSSQSSTSTAGLTPEFMAKLSSFVDTLSPIAKNYAGVSDKLKDTSSFVQSYKPVQDQMVAGALGQLAQRGLVNSGEKSKMLSAVMKNAPVAYLQNLLGVTNALGSGAQIASSAIGQGQISQSGSKGGSSSSDDSVGTKIMADLMTNFYA